MSEIDALIVGAGPTGMAMATDLIRHGLRVRIIERADEPTRLSKAVVLMPRTVEEFQLRGLHTRALSLSEKIHSFSLFSHGHIIFRAEYGRMVSRYNYLLNIPQTDSELVLREELDRLGGKVEWRTQLDEFEDRDDHVLATIRHADQTEETIKVPYLLGCDGAHSTVRHGVGIEFEGESYHDVWLLADVELDWKLKHGQGYGFFSDEGLLATFPMPDGRYRIYIIQPEDRQLGRQPELADIEAAVERIMPGFVKLSNSAWMAEFHCHHRKVRHYRKGRVFLAGDAAHIHSPETGLGMNTGIQDAFNLAWKLAHVHKGWSPENLLDSYDIERNYVGKQVVDLSDFTHKMSAQFNVLGRVTRDQVWRFFSNYYHHHFDQFEAGFQLRIQYKHSHIVEQHGKATTLHDTNFEVLAGTRCYDCEILEPATSKWVWLYDLLSPSVHHIILMAGPNPTPEILAAIQNVAQHVSKMDDRLKLMLLLGRQDMAGFGDFPGSVYLDPALHFHYTYGGQNGAIFVVRPDAYVGYVSYGFHETATLKLYLTRLFSKEGH